MYILGGLHFKFIIYLQVPKQDESDTLLGKKGRNQVAKQIIFPLGHMHTIMVMQHLRHTDIYLGLA